MTPNGGLTKDYISFRNISHLRESEKAKGSVVVKKSSSLDMEGRTDVSVSNRCDAEDVTLVFEGVPLEACRNVSLVGTRDYVAFKEGPDEGR